MRLSTTWLASLVLGMAAFAGFVVADETSNGPVPVAQKPIKHAFLDSIIGTWTSESTSIHDGKEHKATGKVTYLRGIGDTAILQSYESSGPGPDGKTIDYHGHGVCKLSDDGGTLNVWWFCNMAPEPMKMSGPLTENGFTLTGDGPKGKMTIRLKQTPEGLSVRGTEGAAEVMTETYTRAR